MGNCQAAEAAAVVIHHPSGGGGGGGGGGGRVERAHGAVSAAAVMAANPGHYVAAVVPAPPPPAAAPVRRRLKLLRPDDTLVVGGVYCLVSFEDVLTMFVSKRSHPTPIHAAITADGAGEAPEPGRQQAKCTQEKAGAHQEDPSSPSPVDEPRLETETETEPEPHFMAAAMALGGRLDLSGRHGQWRPALPSIAEGSVVC
ncbi:hypothetical protein ABZP36_030476 [Zizania latifolia]